MMLEELIINYNSKREDLEEEDQPQDERNVILFQVLEAQDITYSTRERMVKHRKENR